VDLWSAEAERALRTAGWYPGRRVDTTLWRDCFEPVGLPLHEAAQRFLAEFGGLTFEISGPGITRAKEPFELDPTLCDGEDGFLYVVVDFLMRFGAGVRGMEDLLLGVMGETIEG
jgi:hypothetical protein